MSVGYSRRTSLNPAAMASGRAASSSCKCASTPSFCRPGSSPISYSMSRCTAAMAIVSVSPLGLLTTHSSGVARSSHGPVIQLSGL